MPATVTFDDEFNSLNLYNGKSGTWSTTTAFADPTGTSTTLNGTSIPGNGEQEWYINANYAPTSSVKPWTVDSNGILTLTAQKTDPSIANLLGYNEQGYPAMGSYQYTSGLLETNHSFAQTYGYFEMNAQMPAGQGVWPAFWLMPADGSWPPELDILEQLGQDPSTIYTTVHTLQTGSHTASGVADKVGDTTTGMHKYAVDWEKDHITWYFDDKPVYQVNTPADLNKPMYILLNLAMGGYWPGPVGSGIDQAQMKIDYVKVWDSNPYSYTPEGTTGAGQTFTGQANDKIVGTTGDDLILASAQGNETFTGQTGHDTYVFNQAPWGGNDHITDFKVGSDKLDLHALLNGYTGSDPIKDGWVLFQDDGNGGKELFVYQNGPPPAGTQGVWPSGVVDLEGVTDVGLTSANLFVNNSLGQTAASTFSTSNTFQVAADGAAVSTPTQTPTDPGSTSTTPPVTTPPVTTPTDSGPHVITGAAGTTITGLAQGDTLVGAGSDTLIASAQGSETMTGGGHSVFKFNSIPWTPDHITDFTPGVDKLDLHALFPNYTGTDPIADGYVYLQTDAAGTGTNVLVNPDGHATAANPWPGFVVDLDNVSIKSLTAASLFEGGSSTATTPTPSDPGASTGTTTGTSVTAQATAAVTNLLQVSASTGAGAAIASELSSAATTAQGVSDLQHAGLSTTSVANMTYEFFTGTTPTAGGLGYLVGQGGGNANSLNSGYYQAFNTENRFINFAVNLGTGAGAGAAKFAQTYGGESLVQATHDIYQTIFGTAPTDAKVAALLDATIDTSGHTRADYFAQIGGSDIGAKAAMAGWLMAEAAKADVGTYALSHDAYIADVATHGATVGVDMVGVYNHDTFAYTGG